MSDKIELRRRELLGGVATIGVAAVGAGATTYAFLSDQSQADVTINVGSLTLSDPAPIEWSEDPSTEGEDTFSDSLTIENTGNLPARQVLLESITVNDQGLAKALEVLDVRYGQDSVSSILSDIEANNNGNGIYDLDDLRQSLATSSIALEDLAGTGTLYEGATATLEIDARYDYSKIPDSKDGAALEATFSIRGKQDDPDDT